MDPNATLISLFDCISHSDFTEAREHCGNLLHWLANGGFEPAAWKPFAAAGIQLVKFLSELSKMLEVAEQA